MPESHDLKVFTRRDLLKSAGLAGAAAVAPLGGVIDAGEQTAPQGTPRSAPATPAAAASHTGDALEALTATELETLDAMCARIVPSDGNGPGAREAKVCAFGAEITKHKGEIRQKFALHVQVPGLYVSV